MGTSNTIKEKGTRQMAPAPVELRQQWHRLLPESYCRIFRIVGDVQRRWAKADSQRTDQMDYQLLLTFL